MIVPNEPFELPDQDPVEPAPLFPIEKPSKIRRIVRAVVITITTCGLLLIFGMLLIPMNCQAAPQTAVEAWQARQVEMELAMQAAMDTTDQSGESKIIASD